MLDAWSRKVVGSSINKRATTAMVNDPIAMAITQRARRDGVLIHLNLGPHYREPKGWGGTRNGTAAKLAAVPTTQISTLRRRVLAGASSLRHQAAGGLQAPTLVAASNAASAPTLAFAPTVM
jgi:hypothetical protein